MAPEGWVDGMDRDVAVGLPILALFNSKVSNKLTPPSKSGNVLCQYGHKLKHLHLDTVGGFSRRSDCLSMQCRR